MEIGDFEFNKPYHFTRNDVDQSFTYIAMRKSAQAIRENLRETKRKNQRETKKKNTPQETRKNKKYTYAWE